MSVAQLLAVALTLVGLFLWPAVAVMPGTKTCRRPEGEGTTVVINLPLHEPSHIPDLVGNDSLPEGVFGIRA